MKRCFFVMFVSYLVLTMAACGSTKLVSSADLVGDVPKTKIVGPLGLPLGEYMTIEGRACAVGKVGKVEYQSLEGIARFGVHSLEVCKVNGVALKAPVIISLSQSAKFRPALYFVVRGYQMGEYGPGNPDPEDPEALTGQKNYQFWVHFVATKDLTKDKEAETNKAVGTGR